MKHLVVGYGEVGQALGKVLGEHFYTDTKSEGNWQGEKVDVVHICFPYSKDFSYYISALKELAPLVLVHSSVPVGTCDDLGVVHSPINGIHPHLEEGIRTFVKYFGGKNAKKAAKIFEDLGIETKVFKEAKTTEASKLWSTTQFGRMIMLEKEIYEWCQKNDVDFDDVYTKTNVHYNDAYTKLGQPQFVRPYLKHMPGPIQGHCVVPNAKLLKVKL